MYSLGYRRKMGRCGSSFACRPDIDLRLERNVVRIDVGDEETAATMGGRTEWYIVEYDGGSMEKAEKTIETLRGWGKI